MPQCYVYTYTACLFGPAHSSVILCDGINMRVSLQSDIDVIMFSFKMSFKT